MLVAEQSGAESIGLNGIVMPHISNLKRIDVMDFIISLCLFSMSLLCFYAAIAIVAYQIKRWFWMRNNMHLLDGEGGLYVKSGMWIGPETGRIHGTESLIYPGSNSGDSIKSESTTIITQIVG